MRGLFGIVILMLALLPCASFSIADAYEYRMPVNIQCDMTPGVLMPGDDALLAITLQNGAAAYGVGRDAGVGSNSQSALLSTPINRTMLTSTPNIQVISNDYKSLGMIGPNDKITIYYKIKASKNISDGTYLMDFAVVGGYDMITIHREIPVKVDSSAVSIARAESSTSGFNLNIANPRENTVNAVTITPSAKGIIFSPDEYYIGTMDPDEVFTINFRLESNDPNRPLSLISKPVNLTFVAKFKNGDNWQKSEPYVAAYSPPRDNTNQSSYLFPAALAVLILAGIGAYLYRRRKQSRYK